MALAIPAQETIVFGRIPSDQNINISSRDLLFEVANLDGRARFLSNVVVAVARTNDDDVGFWVVARRVTGLNFLDVSVSTEERASNDSKCSWADAVANVRL